MKNKFTAWADLPQGWQISSNRLMSSRSCQYSPAAGQSVDLNVSTIRPGVEAGEYEVDVYAVSALGQVSERLTLIVSGSYHGIYYRQ